MAASINGARLVDGVRTQRFVADAGIDREPIEEALRCVWRLQCVDGQPIRASERLFRTSSACVRVAFGKNFAGMLQLPATSAYFLQLVAKGSGFVAENLATFVKGRMSAAHLALR